jgi:thiol-disulfide isomerase/thioredoxin
MNFFHNILVIILLFTYVQLKSEFLFFNNKNITSLKITIYFKNPIIKDLKISEFELRAGDKNLVQVIPFDGALFHIAVNDDFRKIIPSGVISGMDTIRISVINDNITINQTDINKICDEYYFLHKNIYSRYPSGFRIYFKDTLNVFLNHVLKCYDTLMFTINNYNAPPSAKKHYLNEIHLQILENIYYYLKYYNIYKYGVYKGIGLTNDIIHTINAFESKLDTNYLLYFNSDNYLLRKMEYYEIIHCNETDTCMGAWDYYINYKKQNSKFDLFYIGFKLKNIKNKNEFYSLLVKLRKLTSVPILDIKGYLALKILMQYNLNSFNLKDIYFKNYEGKKQFICMDSNKNKYLLVGASWCEPCRNAFSELLELENINNTEFEYIYLLIDENKTYIEKILKELKQKKSNIRLLIDSKNFNNEVLKKFNIDAIPKIFILNNKCEVIEIK